MTDDNTHKHPSDAEKLPVQGTQELDDAAHQKMLDEIERMVEQTEGVPRKQLEQQAEQEEAEADTPKISPTPETPFSNISDENIGIARAFEAAKQIIPTITEQDREDYLKAVLLDEPFTYTLSRANGAFNCTFRTRTVREQEAIARCLRIGTKVGDIPADNNLIQLSMIQYFTLGFSLLSVNETSYVPIDVTQSRFKGAGLPRVEDVELREDPVYTQLMEFTDSLRESNQVRLHAIVEMARVFETLAAVLASELTKENFS